MSAAKTGAAVCHRPRAFDRACFSSSLCGPILGASEQGGGLSVVKVHVWPPDEQNVGHTAITIGSVYVSFWPEGSAGKKDLKIKRSHPGSFVLALMDDIRNEGGRPPITVELPNLKEDPILAYVNRLQQSIPRYQLARNNCSHVVARCLIEGAGSGPSFSVHAGGYSRLWKGSGSASGHPRTY